MERERSAGLKGDDRFTASSCHAEVRGRGRLVAMKKLHLSNEVAEALANKRPVVALESTIISHGLPRPSNLTVAKEVEALVRENGAVPATIAICEGRITVGLTPNELQEIAGRNDVAKASTRDCSVIASRGGWAATTVASTAQIASLAGISLFATGGLGGVHRGASESFDESADLTALSHTPITVVSSGVKSILDVAATLERLETLGIAVLGYQCDYFPGFYLKDSGHPLEYRVETPEEVARVMDSAISDGALLVANPAPEPMDPATHQKLLDRALSEAALKGIKGKAVTPFILEYFHSNSEGVSLRINTEIIKSNAVLAAKISLSFAQIKQDS